MRNYYEMYDKMKISRYYRNMENIKFTLLFNLSWKDLQEND